jgi:tetratricopeptide (TPR) repeat protein
VRESPTRVLPRSVPSAVATLWIATLVAGGWAARHTLDSEDARLRQAVSTGMVDASMIDAAIARHPSDDYLELLAAESALRAHDNTAMHHLNRALRLHPANWQAHRLAGRLVAALGRRSQAALEYRLAARYGWLSDDNELVRVLGPHVIDAVAQDPQTLLGLAVRLIALGNLGDGTAAGERAVDVADRREPVLALRAELALDGQAPPLLERWSRALAGEATSVESFSLAARGLAKAGDLPGALQLVARARKAMPRDPDMILVAARLQLDAGDLAAVRMTLASPAAAGLTLAQRQQAEQLLAEASERSGDAEAAAVARARARMIERQLRQNSTVEGVPR